MVRRVKIFRIEDWKGEKLVSQLGNFNTAGKASLNCAVERMRYCEL